MFMGLEIGKCNSVAQARLLDLSIPPGVSRVYNSSRHDSTAGKGNPMIIAELAIFPTSEGASVSRFIREAIRALESSGLKTETGAMSTTVEAPDFAALWRAIEAADAAVARMGAARIHIDLRIDHRSDKDATIASKKKAVGKG